MAFASGMVTSWNKLCFTGGYLEVSVQMPGDDFYSGFWPAVWLMGNLGRAGARREGGGLCASKWPRPACKGARVRRPSPMAAPCFAGYLESTTGFWPYSYDVCDAAAGVVDWSSLSGQSYSACPDTSGQNRTRFGWTAGVGRGAPEVDMFEMRSVCVLCGGGVGCG